MDNLHTNFFSHLFVSIHLLDTADVLYTIVPPLIDTGFHTLTEEWYWIRQMKDHWHEKLPPPYQFQLPKFIAKKGIETDQL